MTDSAATETQAEGGGITARVAARLRAARETAALTQSDLADRLNVTQTAVSYWESGQRSISLDDLGRCADALGVGFHLLCCDPNPASTLPGPVSDYGYVRLELMGHRYREGHLSEVVIAGTPFLQLVTRDGATEMYRPDAVYCLTPAPGAPGPLAALTARVPADLEDDEGDDEDDYGYEERY
jgi:transcriptional regulator with XRE-family HTH domain